MNQQRKVFIPNRGGHDYSGVTKFGTPIYVTEGRVNRFDTTSLYRDFIAAMADSTPDDYLVPAGMNVLNAIGAAVFARLHGRLNLLVYKGDEEGTYTLRTVDIDSLMDLAEGKISNAHDHQ